MISKRLKALRNEMIRNDIDYYIIPTNDFHHSEYVCDHFKCREFMSGFTGSAGTLLVGITNAILWTDGRYFIQAEEQLKNTGIELYKSGNPGVPSIFEYIKTKLQPDEVVGFDGRVMSMNSGFNLGKIAHEKSALISYKNDLVGTIWDDRPEIKAQPIYILDEKYAGESAASKLEKIRHAMKKNACDYNVITSLDNIAWLLNLRGNDIPCNPVFLSYLILSEQGGMLFCHPTALSSEVISYLKTLSIDIYNYDEIFAAIEQLPEGSRFACNDNEINFSLYRAICDIGEAVPETDLIEALKARKNDTEIENLRKANIIDGIAMAKFLCWLDEKLEQQKTSSISETNTTDEELSELSISAKLKEFRAEAKEFKDISFETIAAFGAHGAIVHYDPTEESNALIKQDSFILLDSGSQYLEGTTDITRTISTGTLSEDMKKHYTAVLRGNLRMSAAVFPSGACGANLDILARGPLWQLRKDYNHGTGHGIGYFLNVHEGPQNVHWRIGPRKGNSLPLAKGMLISDEPGIYIENEYGIRIENDLLVQNDIENEYASFMKFEVMTLAPIDLKPVIKEDMLPDEIATLNSYHARVYKLISPYLDEHTKSWLKKATEAI